jgi:hypothetical protein
MFLTIQFLVKLHAIKWCAGISYGLDLMDLLTIGWPEDGLLKPETCSHSQKNIIFKLFSRTIIGIILE